MQIAMKAIHQTYPHTSLRQAPPTHFGIERAKNHFINASVPGAKRVTRPLYFSDLY